MVAPRYWRAQITPLHERCHPRRAVTSCLSWSAQAASHHARGRIVILRLCTAQRAENKHLKHLSATGPRSPATRSTSRLHVTTPRKQVANDETYGWYANRPRGMRRQAEPAEAETPPAIVPAPRLAPTEAARRWAKALRRRCCNRSSRSTRGPFGPGPTRRPGAIH